MPVTSPRSSPSTLSGRCQAPPDAADLDWTLLPRLAELYPDPSLLFLIVDDESPDGTGRLVREFAAADARVHLLQGRKRGLGAAYVRSE